MAATYLMSSRANMRMRSAVAATGAPPANVLTDQQSSLMASTTAARMLENHRAHDQRPDTKQSLRHQQRPSHVQPQGVRQAIESEGVYDLADDDHRHEPIQDAESESVKKRRASRSIVNGHGRSLGMAAERCRDGKLSGTRCRRRSKARSMRGRMSILCRLRGAGSSRRQLDAACRT